MMSCNDELQMRMMGTVRWAGVTKTLDSIDAHLDESGRANVMIPTCLGGTAIVFIAMAYVYYALVIFPSPNTDWYWVHACLLLHTGPIVLGVCAQGREGCSEIRVGARAAERGERWRGAQWREEPAYVHARPETCCRAEHNAPDRGHSRQRLLDAALLCTAQHRTALHSTARTKPKQNSTNTTASHHRNTSSQHPRGLFAIGLTRAARASKGGGATSSPGRWIPVPFRRGPSTLWKESPTRSTPTTCPSNPPVEPQTTTPTPTSDPRQD
eukprot:2685158-Rhodomonas_salina.3